MMIFTGESKKCKTRHLDKSCELLTCACTYDMFFNIRIAKIPLSGQKWTAYSIDGWLTILNGTGLIPDKSKIYVYSIAVGHGESYIYLLVLLRAK